MEERSTRERLMDAAEHLFAIDGVHGARIHQINEIAGQRNPSAIHYHFGSRIGFAEAILLRFQAEIDADVQRSLDAMEASETDLTIETVVSCVVPPFVSRLETQSGRDCVRIIPQVLGGLSRNLRRGTREPTTPQTARVLTLLDSRMAELGVDEPLRWERLVSYSIVLTTLLAERAHALEDGDAPLLDDETWTRHLTGLLVAVLVSPSS